MSQADKLLNSLSENDITSYTVDPALEEHIIIDSDRNVIVPDSLRRIAVQGDHNIETVTFDCPRYWDGHDMSKMVVYINYACSDGVIGNAVATNVVVDEHDPSIMHFDWTIMGDVTRVEGFLTFLVCIKKVTPSSSVNGNGLNVEIVDGELVISEGVGSNRHWHSELCNDMYISKGLELPDDYVRSHPDILTQILMFNADIIELNRVTMQRAAVYLGSGDMPDGYNVQIDPDGDDVYSLSVEELNYIVTLVLANLPDQSAISIDKTMSDTSTNPVQNKAIKAYIDDLIGDVESAISEINDIIGGA